MTKKKQQPPVEWEADSFSLAIGADSTAIDSRIDICGKVEEVYATETLADVDAAIALAERRRKMREVQQRFRAKKKRTIAAMWQRVCELEVEYDQVFATKIAQQLPQQLEATYMITLSVAIADQYASAKYEAELLRVQIAERKKKLMEYDLFITIVERYHMEFSQPPTLTTVIEELRRIEGNTDANRSFPVLTEYECQKLTLDSFKTIFCSIGQKNENHFHSAKVFGWNIERAGVQPGTSIFEYSISKSFRFASAASLMRLLWHALTADDSLCFPNAKTKMTVVQKINDDVLIVRCRAHFMPITTEVFVHMLAFRVQTETGYVIGTRLLESPLKKRNHKKTENVLSDLMELNTMNWFNVDEQSLSSSDDVDGTANRFAGNSHEAMECTTTVGGRLDNTELKFASTLLVEIVNATVRWDQALSGSKLRYFSEDNTC